MEEFISEEPKCNESYYDQSAFYNCTEWVFSAADNMDGDIAFSLEFYYYSADDGKELTAEIGKRVLPRLRDCFLSEFTQTNSTFLHVALKYSK